MSSTIFFALYVLYICKAGLPNNEIEFYKEREQTFADIRMAIIVHKDGLGAHPAKPTTHNKYAFILLNALLLLVHTQHTKEKNGNFLILNS